MMLSHLVLSKIYFRIDDLKALSCNGKLLFSLLEFSLNNNLICLIQLIKFVAIVICEHALYADSDVTWLTEIFYLLARVADAVHELIVLI
jgi:hypothetical protein